MNILYSLALHFTAIEGAWTTAFQGKDAELFQFTLDQMNQTCSKKLYANFVPIIQSSGMGKSRLVDKTAKLIFMIPFCLRSAQTRCTEGGTTFVCQLCFNLTVVFWKEQKSRNSLLS
jgi:hypothetical protein